MHMSVASIMRNNAGARQHRVPNPGRSGSIYERLVQKPTDISDLGTPIQVGRACQYLMVMYDCVIRAQGAHGSGKHGKGRSGQRGLHTLRFMK